MPTSNSTKSNPSLPSWKLRRRAVFGSLIFCGVLIAWAVVTKADTQVAESAVLGAFATISVIISAYIGGAVYEDVRLTQLRKVENDQSESESETD
jgi:uncharacterized membrane protein YcjF (UPF0283 family)